MITSGSHSRPKAIGATIQFLVRSKWFLTIAIAAIATVAATLPPPVSDENTDEEYIRVMNLMDRADALRATGKADAAKAKDQEAYRALVIFQKTHPKWNKTTVDYRLNQLVQEIEGRTAESESEAPTKSRGRTNLEAPAKHASYKSTIKLLDPGSEPRKLLRLHPKANDKQSVLLTLKMTMDMPGMGGGAGAPNLPAMTVPADISIDSVAPNGDITFKAVLGEAGFATEAGLPPGAGDAAKKSFASAKGLALTVTMSSTGLGRIVDIDAPPGAPADTSESIAKMKQSLSTSHIALPLFVFPEEAVGSGAKWEAKTALSTNGMDMAATATYQLTSADGDHVSVSKTVDFTLKGSPQKNQQAAAAPMMPFGSVDVNGSMKGTSAFDLSKLIPLQSTSDIQVAMSMGMKTPKGSQPMSMKMDINVGLEAH